MRLRPWGVVLGLVAACGDGLAPSDAVPPIDGPPGRVTVRYEPGEQAPTVQVLFQNADSSLVLATRTGPDGSANAFMAPGGYVTAIATNSFQYNLFTWADVQPGDELVLGSSFFSPPGEVFTSFPLRIPLDPGQDTYELITACGTELLSNPSGISFVQLPAGCGPRQDLIVVSRDFTFSNDRYLHAADVLLDGSQIDLPGPWRPFDIARVEVAGMPVATQSMNTSMVLLDEKNQIVQSDRGGSFPLAAGAGALEFGMPLPSGIGALVQVTPSFQQGAVAAVRALHWGPAQSTTRFDASQNPLRLYHEFPTYLRSQHAVPWSESGPGTAADAVFVEFSFRGDDFMQKHWTILAPGNDEAIVRYPRLPITSLMPGSGDDVFQPSTLTSIRLDHGGYARVKRSLPIDWGSGFPWPLDAPEGTVVIQELGSPILFPD